MRTSETIAAIAPAIVAAFGKIEGAAKSAKNEAFKRGNTVSTYATLADAIKASQSVLAENGLATIQGVGELVDDGNLRCILITTRLLHTSGEWFDRASRFRSARWTRKALALRRATDGATPSWRC